MFELDYLQKAKEIQDFIANTVYKAGCSNVVVAVSGGVDSAVSLNLSVRALGKEHVYVLLLPHGDLSLTSLKDGRLVATQAGLSRDHIFVQDIQNTLNVILGSSRKNEGYKKGVYSLALPQNDRLFQIRKGNMMARVRMIFTFDLAKSLNALVIGTENKTEYFLGYFTRFGDEASDIEPIRALYKTQVWEIAKYLQVPEKIIEKAPSAGLWEGQKDEGEFGFTYLDADRVLYHYFEEKLSKNDIVERGIDKKLVEKVLSFAQKNDFKHHVPYVFE